jgi:hypothetical protein
MVRSMALRTLSLHKTTGEPAYGGMVRKVRTHKGTVATATHPRGAARFDNTTHLGRQTVEVDLSLALAPVRPSWAAQAPGTDRQAVRVDLARSSTCWMVLGYQVDAPRAASSSRQMAV